MLYSCKLYFGALMHALDGASMLLFNVIFTHTIIAKSMDIFHTILWQIPRNHIAAPQDPHARQPSHVTWYIHAYTRCSIHAY